MKNEFTDPRHRIDEPHTSFEIWHTLCDNCPDMNCIPQKKSKLHKERYYCDALHKPLSRNEIFAMTTEQCPRDREPERRY